ncbi:MAG TPA: PTS transporter subunit IIC, partial [Atopobiaceae bacterium]|nr:PTS transporter subunit IIC [Atopobiaceae bacterium]
MLDILVSLLDNAYIVLAFVAALGLILLKKSPSEVLQGTIKTVLGFLILNAGAGVIMGALTPFANVFTEAFHLSGFIAEDNSLVAAVQSMLGFETSMIMVL